MTSDTAVAPAPVETRKPAAWPSLVVGAAASAFALFPSWVGGARLPLQNLWHEQTMPDDMPISLLPLSQYYALNIFVMLLLGGVIAGLIVRWRRLRAGMAALGVLAVQVIVAVQSFAVLAGGHGLLDGTAGSRELLYFGGMLGGVIAGILLAQLGCWMASRRTVRVGGRAAGPLDAACRVHRDQLQPRHARAAGRRARDGSGGGTGLPARARRDDAAGSGRVRVGGRRDRGADARGEAGGRRSVTARIGEHAVPATFTSETAWVRFREEHMKQIATKLVGAVALLTLLGGGAVGCSAGSDATTPKSDSQGSSPSATEEAPAPKPVDLTGTWKQTNSNSADSYQAATVVGETIEIQWVAPDVKSLYWAGTVEVPQDGSTDFTWDSVNDKTKTAKSIMASGDDTKTFTYKDGELSYELTALGTTMTVRMAKE